MKLKNVFNLVHKLLSEIINLPKFYRISFVIILDIMACPALIMLSFYIREDNLSFRMNDFLIISLISTSILIPLLYVFKLHTELIRFNNFNKFILPAKVMFLYACIFCAFIFVVNLYNIPRSIAALHPMLFYIYYVISRIALFKIANYYINFNKVMKIKKNVLIYGTDAQLISISNIINESNLFSLIGFIEKDKQMIGRNINGFPIFNYKKIEEIILKNKVNLIVISPLKFDVDERHYFIETMINLNVSIITPKSLWSHLYKKQDFLTDDAFDIYDLVGRKPIKPIKELLEKNVKNKVILITGAGGSIGTQLTMEIMSLSPKLIIALDNSELSLYNLENLINKHFKDQVTINKLILVNASVIDVQRIESIIKYYKPNVVYHAAALKHVPIVENNPGEATKVNVMGTINVVNASIKQNISNFVFVSTDKVVRPTNIMGATKRISEKVIQSYSKKYKNINFTIVRFGNVIGSSGSVIPKFKQQIKNSMPITLTHLQVTRYFMTIPEAAQLIIQASSLSKNGGMYVLDMGNPIKIYNVAKRLIQLSGLTLKDKQNPLGDIEIKTVGLRPGEKMYEELTFSGLLKDTSHQSIKLIEEEFVPIKRVKNLLNEMIVASDDFDNILKKKLLKAMVPDYKTMN